MNNLTRSQIFSIFSVILGVLVASTGQLNDLLGPAHTKIIVSLAGLLSAIVSGVGAIVTGQGQQVKDVQKMEGVEKIVVNEKANATLATLAVDPAQAKVEITPAAEKAVEATAKAAS